MEDVFERLSKLADAYAVDLFLNDLSMAGLLSVACALFAIALLRRLARTGRLGDGTVPAVAITANAVAFVLTAFFFLSAVPLIYSGPGQQLSLWPMIVVAVLWVGSLSLGVAVVRHEWKRTATQISKRGKLLSTAFGLLGGIPLTYAVVAVSLTIVSPFA